RLIWSDRLLSRPSMDSKNNTKPSTKKILNRGQWSKEDDMVLKRLVEELGEELGEEEWTAVANNFPDRNSTECRQRWNRVLNPKLKKGKWTEEVSGNEFSSPFTSLTTAIVIF